MQYLLLKRDTIPFLNTSEAMKLHLNPLVPGIHYYKLGQLLQIEVIVITRCTADVNLFNDKAIWKPVLFKAVFFFSIRAFFTDIADSQDSRGREGTIF